MNLAKLKQQMDLFPDDDNIYLLESITDSAGFFVNNSQLYYLAEDDSNYSYESIETDFLKLQSHIKIHSVTNSSTYRDGYYNSIVYLNSLEESNAESFIKFCILHAVNQKELSFKDFFYSLISLFQLPSEQAYKNAIGLYGELKFMQYSKDTLNKDISNFWHARGSLSQYDFSNGEMGIEVKTTTTDTRDVSIKHNQIFENENCYLAVVDCSIIENGETIEDLIKKMEADKCGYNSINFSINLEKEKKRVSKRDLKELRFTTKSVKFFDTLKLNPFPVVPDNVNKLKYRLDLSDSKPLTQYEELKLLERF